MATPLHTITQKYAKRCYVLYSEAIGNLQQVAEESEGKLLLAQSLSNPQQVAVESIKNCSLLPTIEELEQKLGDRIKNIED